MAHAGRLRDILIGIDPGEQTGVCVFNRPERKIVSVYLFDFWDAFDYVSGWECGVIDVFIENPDLNKFTYGRHSDAVRGAALGRVNRNAGGNAREAVLLIRGLQRKGYRVHEVRPVKSKKWTSEQFEMLTGISRSNQHVRDAVRLVYGY